MENPTRQKYVQGKTEANEKLINPKVMSYLFMNNDNEIYIGQHLKNGDSSHGPGVMPSMQLIVHLSEYANTSGRLFPLKLKDILPIAMKNF